MGIAGLEARPPEAGLHSAAASHKLTGKAGQTMAPWTAGRQNGSARLGCLALAAGHGLGEQRGHRYHREPQPGERRRRSGRSGATQRVEGRQPFGAAGPSGCAATTVVVAPVGKLVQPQGEGLAGYATRPSPARAGRDSSTPPRKASVICSVSRRIRRPPAGRWASGRRHRGAAATICPATGPGTAAGRFSHPPARAAPPPGRRCPRRGR